MFTYEMPSSGFIGATSAVSFQFTMGQNIYYINFILFYFFCVICNLEMWVLGVHYMWIFETHKRLKVKLMTKTYRLLLQRKTR
jgi:hypothetical protein